MARKSKTKSDLETAFLTYWRMFARESPEPEHDVTFCPGRRWRADYIWKPQQVIVELEGKVWGSLVHCHVCGVQVRKHGKNGGWYPVREAGGRHTRGAGFENDVQKYNTATSMGFRLFRVTKKMLDEDPCSTIMMIREAVENGQ